MKKKNGKKEFRKRYVSCAAVLLGLLLALSGCGQSSGDAQNAQTASNKVKALVRSSFLGEEESTEYTPSETPAVETYEIAGDLSNISNLEQYAGMMGYPGFQEKLTRNGFVVRSEHSMEFFPIYELNRYQQEPNYVTVDSLMHTYHLAFSYILRKTEKDYLFHEISSLSMAMYEDAASNYTLLKGTEWEEAATFNLMFFAVGAVLSGQNPTVPTNLKAAILAEKDLIMEAAQMTDSPVLTEPLDYSQFKPRGYYEGDETLEQYFRTMIWYGLTAFPMKDQEGKYENLTRAAVLTTLSLTDSKLESWEKIYTVTSFFTGASDDLAYYELRPAIESVYGEDVTVDDLAGDEKKWNKFYDLSDTLRAPEINSMITLSDKQEEPQKEFRFMGQRYTIDAEIMQKLVYAEVDENANHTKRMLPDTLDVPASMGSDTAVSILEEKGDTSYPGYMDNLSELRERFANEEDPIWDASLYSSWLHTLSPTLRTKGEGYPSYMQNEEWSKKALETFSGSYAELKHDTVLYTKQMGAAEMGGPPQDEIDDRGYVEPESEVYARFAALSTKTRDGLARYGMLSAENEEDLNILTELGESLFRISEKELKNETLADDEYDLIRYYGGNIEHFWEKQANEVTGAEHVQISEFPADTIVDIATDLDSQTALEIGVGGASRIYVIAPVDGKLKIVSGAVYNFYQFEQPSASRLTDSEWRDMVYTTPQPAWTQSYRCE